MKLFTWSTGWMGVLVCLLAGVLPLAAAERVPEETWQRYADVTQAGFDADKLERAYKAWDLLPSSAFLVISDGAVVASWGDVERRFMCHSVRKSFLTALYGIYWDRGVVDLNKTLADLGIDDHPEPLLETERNARILDLLKARSGVFHPAAYAGRTDSRPRGSEGPGRYFAYNNWDFNTAATILMQEAEIDIFEAFDEHFGGPLGMEDWRVSDGYYHYERDKSRYPAYPFRMSARDAARIGLLYAREGLWGTERILSRHWVRRSSALYSIDDDVMGYGFMWWVMREPRFEQYGMYAALGVGNQMIAVLPDINVVIVNRANTYQGERTPMKALLNLIEQVLEARTGEPATQPRLVPLEPAAGDERATSVSADELSELVGEWKYPPPSLGMGSRTTVDIEMADGHLVTHSPVSGTFELYLQPDGTLLEEDSWNQYLPVRDSNGNVDGIADASTVAMGALVAAGRKDSSRAASLLASVPEQDDLAIPTGVIEQLVDLLAGKSAEAEAGLGELASRGQRGQVERIVNASGYRLMGAEQLQAALAVLQMNSRLFPKSANVWDSLGEVHMNLGNTAEAIRFYEKTLELDGDNSGARAALERLREDAAG